MSPGSTLREYPGPNNPPDSGEAPGIQKQRLQTQAWGPGLLGGHSRDVPAPRLQPEPRGRRQQPRSVTELCADAPLNVLVTPNFSPAAAQIPCTRVPPWRPSKFLGHTPTPPCGLRSGSGS